MPLIVKHGQKGKAARDASSEGEKCENILNS